MLLKINKRYTNLIIAWMLMGGLRRIRKYPLSANQSVPKLFQTICYPTISLNNCSFDLKLLSLSDQKNIITEMIKSVIVNKTYFFPEQCFMTFVQAEFKHSQMITYAIEVD